MSLITWKYARFLLRNKWFPQCLTNFMLSEIATHGCCVTVTEKATQGTMTQTTHAARGKPRVGASERPPTMNSTGTQMSLWSPWTQFCAQLETETATSLSLSPNGNKYKY